MANNVFDASNFIAAIKTVRVLGQDRFKVSGFSGGERITMDRLPGIGLKEAKEFIEDVMALGVQRYLEDQAQAQAVARRKVADHRRQQAQPSPLGSRICGARDSAFTSCCNLVPGHVGRHHDHVTGHEFDAPSDDIEF